jgi:hypothetical protein
MRLTRSPGVFWDVVDGHVVACEPASGEVYRLNATAGYLWAACDDVSVDALAARLADAFPDEDAAALGADVERFVATMRDKGLVSICPEAT